MEPAPDVENPDFKGLSKLANLHRVIRKTVRLVSVLLIPVAFFFFGIQVQKFGEHFYLYYTTGTWVVYVTLALFPITWIYLAIRFRKGEQAGKKAGRILAIGTAGIVVPVWVLSIILSSAPMYPLMKIEKSFVLPYEGWQSELEGNGHSLTVGADVFGYCSFVQDCPEITRTWTKEQTTPVTLDDLRFVAEQNKLHDLAIENCSSINGSTPPDSCYLAGEVEGGRIVLRAVPSDYGSWSISYTLYGPEGGEGWFSEGIR